MPMGRVFLIAAAVVAALVVTAAAHTIKHVLVVMEENRSFDHMLGFRGKGAAKLTGHEFNYVHPEDPGHSPKVFVNRRAPNIAPCDPSHSLDPTSIKIFGRAAAEAKNYSDPSMCGFVQYEAMRGEAKSDYCEVMYTFASEHLPVMNALADEFVLFDQFFASVPGPTWPNRLFCLSGTSMGLTATSSPWYKNEVGRLFPQRTIFDQVAKAGLSWKNYVNDTPWELFLETIARHPENVELMEDFFRDAREGTLPSFAFINPRAGVNMTTGLGSNDMHPNHDVNLGEAFYKDIYEAVRASPQWNDTLLIITFDEHGGFFDSVPPPKRAPPPGDDSPSYPDEFDFARGGIRIPTLLISPWLSRGHVESAPPHHARPSPDSVYELTSIMATTRKLLGIDHLGPLTKRDAWAATFEHLFHVRTTPRADCPVHLPDALPPTLPVEVEAALPINDLQHHIATVHAHLAGVPFPHHIETQRDISHWLQRSFRRAALRTQHWKYHRARPELAARCSPLIGMNPTYLASNWTVSRTSSAPFRTIAASVALDGAAVVEYCLDAPNATRGSVVGVTPCLPSAHPTFNRDEAQHWAWTSQSDIRPIANQTLCITSRCIASREVSTSLTLEPCNGALAQRWAYMGPAPGNEGAANQGLIADGAAIYSIVIDYASRKN